MNKKPVVILISVDGLKWGYQFKTSTPNIDFIKENGVEAFPRLNPAWHGIIANSFVDKGMPRDQTRKRLNDVHIIIVSDHGRVMSCERVGAVVALRPPRGFDAKHIVKKMNEGLQSEKVNNGQFLKVFLKEYLPERLHFSHGKFGQPIIGMASESYTVKLGRSTNSSYGVMKLCYGTFHRVSLLQMSKTY
ncbi:hypothetical protein SELMODRAFT_418856 [Selaginella moellendorffii]|uniref:Uncharacterized protein n=1 Tax=Selaginella moellendorffii TaxID=88036 RepID=D8S710_SELML|nr:hypothetical protein SELMODRAFT_427187 [Selaginella moellendorffii]EFJ19667.1 hypothetical protein SELMODRAFT_418856 [Selaginella moellendorffii]